MEKWFETWPRDQQIDWQSPDPNSLNLQPSFGNMLAPPCKASVPQEPYGWFYGLPRYRQGFEPITNSVPKEQLPVISPKQNCNDNGGQKKFLVFDQSGDQTTLIFSSGIGAAPIQYQLPSRNNENLQTEVKKEILAGKKDEEIPRSYPFHFDEYIEDNTRNDVRSEMREDTEELNALLYSDDDEADSSEEEEETSTGHSPSTMTRFDRPEDNSEEVASSAGPAKRKKLDDGSYDKVSLEDTASSAKSGINCCYDADLSCCGNRGGCTNEEESDAVSSGNKRSRKEKLRETISVLQDLIPGGKNRKDAILVIDEAINYLRSLKVKAKALGLDSL